MSKSKWADPSGSVAIRRPCRCLRTLCLSIVFPVVAFAQVQFAGRQNAVGTFYVPSGVAVDAAGNVYESDVGTSSIYKLDQFGNQTVVAGAVGVFAIAIDSAGNIYYTAFGSNCVNEIPAGGGTINCLGSGLNEPVGIAVDAAANVYVADFHNNQVVEILAGGGQTTLATGFSTVLSVAVDRSGYVYAGDYAATSITKIAPGGGSTSTLGSGLTNPQGVAVDLDGNVYVSQANNTIAEITAAGATSTLPISGLSNPLYLAVDANYNLYIPNRNNGTVVLFNAREASLGYAEVCSGGNPVPCSQTATLNFSFGAGTTFGGAAFLTGGIAGLDFSQSSTTCAVSSMSCSITVQFNPAIPGPRTGAVVVTDSVGDTFTVPLNGVGFAAAIAFNPFVTSAPVGATTFADPLGVAVDANGVLRGNTYVADGSTCEIYQVAASGTITVIAGNGTCGFSGDSGPATMAQLNNPTSLVLDGAGDIYIADEANNVVRKVDVHGTITTVAGNNGLGPGFSGDGGLATSAQLHSPFAVALDGPGNLYIADSSNNRIRKVDLAGIITTVAGSSSTGGYGGDGGPGTAAQLFSPLSVAVDGFGDIFIADSGNNVVRELNLNGNISTVAGDFALGSGYSGDGGPATGAQLNLPAGLAVDAGGELFVCDIGNSVIRRVNAGGTIGTFLTSVVFPEDLASDGTGNLAVVDSNVDTLTKIARTQAGAIVFSPQIVNTVSTPQDATITNAGNQPLAFSGITPSAGFNTSATGISCSTSTSLGNGLDCIIAIAFAPTTVGLINGTIQLTDNNLGPAGSGSQTIPLSGTGLITPTTTTLTAAPNPASTAQTVTLTATVSPVPTGSPLGSINFLDGSTSLGTVNINSSGSAVVMISPLTKGTHTLTAVYSGNADFATSTSTAVSLVVLGATTTTLTGAPNPSMFAQSVTLTATVTSTVTGTPTGTVTFMNGATSLGAGTLNGSGVATLATSTLPVGTLSLTAVYAGDSNFASSTSTALSFTVNKATTTTTLAVAPNPTRTGQSVTLTATIAPIPTGSPLGTVTFLNGATSLGTATPNASGVATLTVTLPAGVLSLTASYGGNASFLSSTSSAVSVTVLASTTTTLGIAPSPAQFGQSVTLTATVSPTPSGSPLGSVNFFNGATNLGSAALNASGVASLSTSSLPVGVLSLTAAYSGNAGFAASTSSPTSLTVTTAATTTTLAGSPNPSTFGQSVTLTATVVSTTTGTPTGSVTFRNGATSLGTGTLNGSGVATLTTSALPVGTLSLTAVYGGDSNFATSTSTALSFIVNTASTATALAATPNPVNLGQQVTLTATITPAPTGAPFGNVTFLNGTTSIGTATPNASGVATLATTTLPAGALSLTAAYAGNANFAASTSTAVTLDVVSPTTTTLAAAPNPAAFGQSVTLTATITPAPTGSPAGSVTFLYGSTNLGTATPNVSGVATLSTSSLPVGSLSLTASYAGNTLFAASTSTVFALTINPTSTTTALTASPSPATFGQSVTLTATVTPTPAGSSLGAVTFFNGATNLGNVALGMTGVATLTLTTLPAGSLSLTASYSGNTDFAASTSAAFPLTVNTTFEITAPTTPFVVGQGGLVTVPVSVPPLGGAYNNVVTLSVNGLPKASIGQFMPPSLTPGAVAGSTTLTIQLAPLAAQNAPMDPSLPRSRMPLYASVVSLLLFARRKRLRAAFRHAALILAAALLGSVLLGCNGGFLRPPSTPPGTYTVTITGTSGTTMQSAQITVVVQ